MKDIQGEAAAALNALQLLVSTQVGVQMTNKCKATMASRRIYKKGNPHEEMG